jgi:hypothetical protein
MTMMGSAALRRRQATHNAAAGSPPTAPPRPPRSSRARSAQTSAGSAGHRTPLRWPTFQPAQVAQFHPAPTPTARPSRVIQFGVLQLAPAAAYARTNGSAYVQAKCWTAQGRRRCKRRGRHAGRASTPRKDRASLGVGHHGRLHGVRGGDVAAARAHAQSVGRRSAARQPRPGRRRALPAPRRRAFVRHPSGYEVSDERDRLKDLRAQA